MTTLASIDAVRFSCSGRSGGTFSPVVLIGGDHPMTGNGPTAAAAAGGGSGSSSGNNTSSLNVGGGNRGKRELELGNEEQPPPPKRMSPIPPRGQDPATRDTHTLMMDPLRSGDPTCDLNLGTAVAAAFFSPADGTTVKATARGMPPRGRSRQPLPFRSDGLHLHHPRDSAAHNIVRAHTTSPPKADAVETIAPPNSNRPVRSMNCLISPSPKLRENVPSTTTNGDLLSRLSSFAGPEPRGGGGLVGEGGSGAGTSASALSATSSMLAGHRRDVLKPSPQQNAGIKCSLDGTRGPSSKGAKEGYASAATAIGGGGLERDDDGGIRGGWGCKEPKGAELSKFSTEDESPGGSRRSMKRPLGGGLRASSSWDGGSASNAPPGTGGGFSAAPACRSCSGAGGGGRGNFADNGQGEDDPQEEACSCKGLRTSLCLSPLPFFRTNSLEISGQDARRHGVGDDELFLLSHAFGPPISPSAGPHDSRGGDGGGGDAVGTDVGGGSGTDGFEMLVPSEGIQGMADDDIPHCMQTLLGSPPRDARASPRHDHITFGGTSFDEAVSEGDGIHGTGGVGNDETSNRNGDMDVESPQGSRTDSGNSSDGEMDSTSTGTSVGRSGAPGPKVGANHQAVIPALSTLKRKGDSRLSPDRSPPLQLWKPGTVSDAAAKYAFPPPHRNGAGSSELEQKLLGAYLIHEAEKEAVVQRRRYGGAAAATTATGGSSSGGGGLGLQSADAVGGAAAHGTGLGGGNGSDSGGGGGSNAEQEPCSLESLSKLVAVGEGAGWRTDWPASDREKFRTGVYAFRRDFHRIRAKFLPHKSHGDVVDYFYRRWKRDPEYAEWKCTEQLVGRRVAKVVEEGFGTMRRGWVSCKELDSRGSLDMQYRVVFPRLLHFEAYSKTFDLGTIETMLVEGFVTEEEKRAEEAASRPRVATSLGGARASSSGLHHCGDGGAGGTGGSSGGHAGGMLGAGLGGGLSGRRLGWNAHTDARYQYAPTGLRHGRVGQGRGNQDSSGEDSGRTTRTINDDNERGEEEEEEDEEETGGNDGDGDDVGSGSGTSDSGPDAETDSTTSVSAGGNGESPVSTSSACFTEPPKGSCGSMVPQSPQQQQLALQLTQELAQESSSSSTAPYSPIRTSTSSTQQQEQQRLLLQTPPLLAPAEETLPSSHAVERRWADVEGFAVDKGVGDSPLLPSAASTMQLGGHHGVDEDGDASAAVGSTGAAQLPSR